MTTGITRKRLRLNDPRIEMDNLVMFPEKIFQVANDDYMIHWLHGGKVIVVDIELLEEKVMEAYPGFLKKSSFLNLRRLFREYGFYWETNEDGYMEFSHPSFLRGHPELLENVNTRRRSCKGVLSRKKKTNCRGELLRNIQAKSTIDSQFSPRRRYQHHRQSRKQDDEKQIIYGPQQIYAIKSLPSSGKPKIHSNLRKVNKEPDPMFSIYFGGQQDPSPAEIDHSSETKDFSYLIDTLDKNENISASVPFPIAVNSLDNLNGGSPNSQLTTQLRNLLHENSIFRSQSSISINNQTGLSVEKPTKSVPNSKALLMSPIPSPVIGANTTLQGSERVTNPSLASFISPYWPCESCKTALFGILTGLCGEKQEVSEPDDNSQWPNQPTMTSDIPVGLPISLFNYLQPDSEEHCESPVERGDQCDDFKQSQYEEGDINHQSDYDQRASEYFEEVRDCEISNVYLISEG